jgi:hypothetical protein
MTTESDAPTMLDKATEAVHDAKEAVQATTQSIAGANRGGSTTRWFPLTSWRAWHAKRLSNPSPLLSW